MKIGTMGPLPIELDNESLIDETIESEICILVNCIKRVLKKVNAFSLGYYMTEALAEAEVPYEFSLNKPEEKNSMVGVTND
jgi:hypothetical protein